MEQEKEKWKVSVYHLVEEVDEVKVTLQRLAEKGEATENYVVDEKGVTAHSLVD